jgi:hypothetical protein
MNKNLSIEEVLKWCNESIEMEGNVNEEILIEKLKEIYNYLYLTNKIGNYYLYRLGVYVVFYLEI